MLGISEWRVLLRLGCERPQQARFSPVTPRPPQGHCVNRCPFRQALPAGHRPLAGMRLATGSARLAPGAAPVSAPVWAAAAASSNPGAALGRVLAPAAALYAGQGRTG